jgi:hypothetical protein
MRPVLTHPVAPVQPLLCVQDLSLSAYSFAVLGVKLPELWWGAFWVASGRCMEAASSQALANMFWAHARQRKVREGLGFRARCGSARCAYASWCVLRACMQRG